MISCLLCYMCIPVLFQNTVIGYFDFHASPQPPGFHQFYLAALRTMSFGRSAVQLRYIEKSASCIFQTNVRVIC